MLTYSVEKNWFIKSIDDVGLIIGIVLKYDLKYIRYYSRSKYRMLTIQKIGYKNFFIFLLHWKFYESEEF